MTRPLKGTSEKITVDITDVYRDALKVPFSQVRKGDWVFDALGARYKLVKARVLKDGVLSIKRSDGVAEHIYPTTPPGVEGRITIVPEHGWTEHGHGYRNVYENDVRVGGEFYETCRCGETFGSGADGDASTADQRLREHADKANGRTFYCG